MSILERIEKGVVARPHSLIVFGPPGVGKSTFAASAPDPLFIDCDNRTAHLDVRRIKPDSWDELLEVLRLVARDEIKCGTVVIDTLDHAEMLLHKSLCELHNVTSIEEVGGGYGKGYIAALGEWRRLAIGMDALRAKGLHVVLLAHSHVRTHKNPLGEDYGRIELKLDKRAHNFLRERVDGVGYASFETVVTKTKEGATKAKTTGTPMLSFKPSAACETKRFAAFPEKCGMTWDALTGGDK